jgi:Domain of unknown function (DUF4383)
MTSAMDIRRWTPAQIAALVFGAWWTLNGVLALTASDSSLSALGVHGKVDAFGIPIAVNGWHAIFHLSTGLTGLAVCVNARASRVYAFAAGSLYLVVAGSGFITSNAALAVIYVDTLGSAIHVAEGLTMLAAGIAATRIKDA